MADETHYDVFLSHDPPISQPTLPQWIETGPGTRFRAVCCRQQVFR